MAIQVICPGCHKRFKVGDQFAGRTGPCPSCKHPIQIPEKGQEVKVHAPKDFEGGGRSTSGKLVLKPISYRQMKTDPIVLTIVISAVLAMLITAWLAGSIFVSSLLIRSVALAAISPAIVFGGYFFLRNDDWEPYYGSALWMRSAICGLCFVVLWGVFAYVSGSVVTGQIWTWAAVAIPIFAMGMLAAVASLDLEMENGFFLYAFYVLFTGLLGWIAGMEFIASAASGS